MRKVAALLLLLAGVEAFGQEAAETCRFRALDAADPFRRWLDPQLLTCAAAGETLAFEPGLWNVFRRTESAVSLPVLVNGEALPDRFDFPLVAAAALSVKLPASHRGVVYAIRGAAAYPVAADGRVTVPAGSDLWLFVMKNGQIAGVVPMPQIPAGGERAVDATTLDPSPLLVGWIDVADDDLAAIRRTRGLLPPRITASASRTHRDAEVSPLDSLDGSFIFVRRPVAGGNVVELSGREWLRTTRRVDVAAEGVTTMRAPLEVRAPGSLVVYWSVHDDVAALDAMLGTCKGRKEPARLTITLQRCTPPRRPADPVDTSTCTLVKEEALQDVAFGTWRADDLIAGYYYAVLRYGNLPPIGDARSVAPFAQAGVTIQLRYVQVYGDVTRGGEPLEKGAALTFPTGTGFAAIGAAAYRGVLTQMVAREGRVDIATCDGLRAYILTDQPIVGGRRFDIDIPDNELEISFVDTFTREPLAATVRYEVMSRARPPRVMVSDTFTAEEGRLRLASVPERELRILVTMKGYEKKTIRPFSLTKSERRQLEVEMVPLRGTPSRLVSTMPFRDAVIYWFDKEGIETEHADVEPDGTFYSDAAHARGEMLVVVSRSHPLWASPAPAVRRGEAMTFAFPQAPSRTVDISVSGGSRLVNYPLDVAVGTLRVPSAVLAAHLRLRDTWASVNNWTSTRLYDILETAPIEIGVGELGRKKLPMGVSALTFEAK